MMTETTQNEITSESQASNAMIVHPTRGTNAQDNSMTVKNSGTKKPKKGEKFVEKYSVNPGDISTCQVYKCLPEMLVIPPKGHDLYDLDGNTTYNEGMVREIDLDGEFAATILVWSDPDNNKLFIVDGRGCAQCIMEVNRRRAARGDLPVLIKFNRLDCDLERAVEHVTMRNFHRKRPTLGHYGREVLKFHRLGKTWTRIAQILNLDPTSPEGGEIRLKRLLSLSYCAPEVVQAIENDQISLRCVRDFAGKELDGSERLSTDEQLQVLADKIAKEPPKKTWLSNTERKSIAAALADKTESIKSEADREAAKVAAAVLARVNGDAKALAAWPELAKVVNAALIKPAKEGAESAE